jgi:hypothetical protein
MCSKYGVILSLFCIFMFSSEYYFGQGNGQKLYYHINAKDKPARSPDRICKFYK